MDGCLATNSPANVLLRLSALNRRAKSSSQQPATKNPPSVLPSCPAITSYPSHVFFFLPFFFFFFLVIFCLSHPIISRNASKPPPCLRNPPPSLLFPYLSSASSSSSSMRRDGSPCFLVLDYLSAGRTRIFAFLTRLPCRRGIPGEWETLLSKAARKAALWTALPSLGAAARRDFAAEEDDDDDGWAFLIFFLLSAVRVPAEVETYGSSPGTKARRDVLFDSIGFAFSLSADCMSANLRFNDNDNERTSLPWAEPVLSDLVS